MSDEYKRINVQDVNKKEVVVIEKVDGWEKKILIVENSCGEKNIRQYLTVLAWSTSCCSNIHTLVIDLDKNTKKIPLDRYNIDLSNLKQLKRFRINFDSTFNS